MNRIVITAVLAAVALSGCSRSGGAANATPSDEGAPTVRGATQAAAPTPAGPAPFGKPATLADEDVTVAATAYAYRALKSQFPPERKGYRFFGADVKVCVTKIPDPSKDVSLSWEPWSLAFADSTTIEPVDSWSDDWFTVPLYSGFGKTVRLGKCLRGWVLFEVPAGKRPVTVNYGPRDSVPLEWKVA